MRSAAVVMVLSALGTAGLGFPAEAAGSSVSIEAVTVEPQSPAAGGLCRLSVRLKNSGTQTATYLRFQVKVDGREEALYEVESYAVNVDPGVTAIIGLHGFWSPSAPKTSFPVEVTLTEAQWAQVKREGQTVTTTPLGLVEGLPVSSTLTVSAAPGK